MARTRVVVSGDPAQDSPLSPPSSLPPTALGITAPPSPELPGLDLCSQHLLRRQGGELGPPSPTDLEAGGPCSGHGVSIFQPHQGGAGATSGIAGQPDWGTQQHGAWQAGWQRDARRHCRAGMTQHRLSPTVGRTGKAPGWASPEGTWLGIPPGHNKSTGTATLHVAPH